MATEAQVAANRLNAQKSTGPRTGAGKAVVAQNAVRHGLLAQQRVIRGEDPGEFEFYRQQMLGELNPAGAMESMLAERVVGLAWRLRRAERIAAQVFNSMLSKDAANSGQKRLRSTLPKEVAEEEENLALGRVVVTDFANYRVQDRLGLYERRIEHSLYKTMAELQKLRLAREAESTSEPASQMNGEPLRQTKPISRVSGQNAGFAGQSKADQSQFREAESLTERKDGRRLIPVGIDCAPMAPARHEPSPASIGHV
jgi:hypothetical protein